MIHTRHLFYLTPPKEKFYYRGNYLTVTQSISLDKNLVGTISVTTSLHDIYTSLKRYMVYNAIIMITALSSIVLLSLLLHRMIIIPILKLEEIASFISKKRDYSLRVKKYSNDEIGSLADTFNNMITNIQMQNTTLERHSRELEGKVIERTKEIRKSEDALRQAKEDAEKANKFKSDFLATMSHEIRTPMNAIIGITELMFDTEVTLQQKEYLETIKTSAELLLNLLNDILDLSKVEAGRLELEYISFDLRAVVQSIVRTMSAHALKKGLIFQTYLATDVPIRLMGDPLRLKQIIVNLVGNAIKFTEKGKVVLKVEKFEQGERENIKGEENAHLLPGQIADSSIPLHITVKDTGIGIPADMLNNIFKDFVQIDSSTTRRFGGTGLGLSISKKLVRMMGGEIWVNSKIGKGSIFHFIVPFSPPLFIKDITPQEAVRVSDKALPLTPLKILIVEDDTVNQKVASGLLDKRGHRITIANNGREAIEILSREDFDIVLMDCQMPEMDGFETTRIIRNPQSSVRNHEITIIAMTAYVMKGEMERCIESGMTDYISKPIRREEFLSKVENLPLPQLLAIDRLGVMSRCDGDEKFVKELWKLFVEDAPDKIEGLKKALESRDCNLLNKQAHSLKSASGTIGAMELADICSQIEIAAKDGNIEMCNRIYEKLEYEFNRVATVLRSYL